MKVIQNPDETISVIDEDVKPDGFTEELNIESVKSEVPKSRYLFNANCFAFSFNSLNKNVFIVCVLFFASQNYSFYLTFY
jgi:hypothetical protein